MTHSVNRLETDSVVIVGAGPVGLLLACELGVRNIPVTVLDDKPGLVSHPKANTQSARSMEIYRKQGISRLLRDRGLPADRQTDIAYFTQLFGLELHRVPMPSAREAERQTQSGDPRWPTPEPQLRVTQMVVDRILLDHAKAYNSVNVCFGHRVTALEQDATGVTLTVLNLATGVSQDIRSAYVVGCDGGKSFVRKCLGIRFLGEGGLEMEFLGGRMLATYFRAPTLLSRFPHRETWMHWIMRPGSRAILLLIDPETHEFLVHFQLGPHESVEEIDFSARLAAIIGEAIPHEIISRAEWRAGMGLVAEHYGAGRCFLAGDAIHLFTPTGGFGLNTGIEDAFNLGWKLAAVCQKRADPTLLQSYETERRAIGLRNTGYALKLAQNNGACPISPLLDAVGPAGEAARTATINHLAEFARWEFDTPGIQLGARYDGSPLLISDHGIPPTDSPIHYTPSGVPGGRLPHIWLADGRSLFDKLGLEFTLIGFDLGDAGALWQAAAQAAGIDLTILDFPDAPALSILLDGQSVLVRPDQHIAWRGDPNTANRQKILEIITGISA